jgi:multiple sugar transport system permease protein
MATLTPVAEKTATARQGAIDTRYPIRRVLGLVLRIVLCLVFGLPLLFMIVSSFKPDAQIFADLGGVRSFLPVGNLSLDNYTGVFNRVPFAQFMVNSILISVVTVVLGVIVNSMAAFSLARIKFRGGSLVLGVILATLIVPFETLALPLLWWVNKLPFFGPDGYSQGWLDTYQVQIIPFIANAFSIFLFYQYFDIIMPLSGPAVATVAILTFLPTWNQYLWPLMSVQSEQLRPVMVGIDYFKQLNVSWGQIMAYASMITAPVLVLFIAFQRAFINSIASSGVKG